MAAELPVGARSNIPARIVIYGLLTLFAVFYLLPLFVMITTSPRLAAAQMRSTSACCASGIPLRKMRYARHASNSVRKPISLPSRSICSRR